jgi:hypothetical protein
MRSRGIHFKGTLRYESRERLERAVVAAHAQLEDEEVTDPSLASLRALTGQGTRLSIDVRLPGGPEVRFAAAAVLGVLASHAVDGAIEARDGDRAVDVFVSGDD